MTEAARRPVLAAGLGVGQTLDSLQRRLLAGDVETALDDLFAWLNQTRLHEEPEYWDTRVRTSVLQHPIADVLSQEPFTASAFHKPRGVPGDAGTLDFMYGALLPELNRPAPGCSSSLVRAAHSYITSSRPLAHAVAGRCRFFAEAIDATAADPAASPASGGHRRGTGRGRVLAIGAGHLRERHLSRAIKEGSIGEVVALDQDALAVWEIAASCPCSPVTPIHASPRRLMTGALEIGQFDLIYAGGLFDSMAERASIALLERLVGLLRPAGRIIVTNFVPAHDNRGYMESFMDWHLVYRTEADLLRIFGVMTPAHPTSARTWLDVTGSLAYLELTRSR